MTADHAARAAEKPPLRWRVKREPMTYNSRPNAAWNVYAPGSRFADWWAQTQPEAFAIAAELAHKPTEVSCFCGQPHLPRLRMDRNHD